MTTPKKLQIDFFKKLLYNVYIIKIRKENLIMTKEQKLASYQNRLNNLKGRGDKNIKCPGVVRKLNRRIMKLQDELGI
jgi:hypothetical protein